MKVVIVNKTPFSSTTFENVTSISYDSTTDNITLTLSNATTHTFVFSEVKVMII